MHSKSSWLAVVSCLLFFVSSAAAQLTVSTPAPTVRPLPSPSSTASINVPQPTATPQPPAANPEQNIPVVITYGQGVQTQVQITRGIMEPVGIPPNQPVTVTLFLGSSLPGTPVQLGLYDGGQFAPAAALPSPPPTGGVTVRVPVPVPVPILVLADRTVRFNFQSAPLLGLYRVLVTIGPKQYLLQFYAVRPRVVVSPLATPTPMVVPPGG